MAQDPSVSSLADALSRSEAAEPARPGSGRFAVARPTPAVRVLVAAAMVLGLLYAAGLMALGSRVSGLVAEVRSGREARERSERSALPAEQVLRDDEAVRREVLARPLAAALIWRARCAVLAEAGEWRRVVETCERVALGSPGDLLPSTRLLQAEGLHRLGRQAEAARLLHAIDQGALDEGERARAAGLAGRLWLSVEGAAEQPGQPAPE